jgi:VWFA-related protein
MSRTAFLGALLLATAGNAQGPVLRTPAPVSDKDTTTLNVDASLVSITAVVRDKHEALVQNLTKDSFVLEVDDHPQTIRYFNVDKDVPLTLGLLIDTSMSYRDVIDEERAASSGFIDEMLTSTPDGNKAFVVQFAREIDLLQDVTSSKPKLHAAINQITSSGNRNMASVTEASGPSGDGHKVTTALYDSLFLSSDEIMSKQKGRKALIVLTDGVDKGSKESLESAAEAALRADTVIYAIYFKGKADPSDRGFSMGQPQNDCGGGYPSGYPGGYPPGGYPGSYPGGCPGGGRMPQGIPLPEAKKTLQHLATKTGGRLFEVSGKNTVAEIYKQIGEELRAQYRLGYTPDKVTSSEGFHRIKLSLANSSPKDFSIQTRDGYYIGSN